MKSLFTNCPLPDIWKKILRITTTIMLFLLCLIFLVVTVIPGFNSQLKIPGENAPEAIYSFSGLSDSAREVLSGLESRKAFLNAQLLASKFDSIVLVISIPDSLVSIELEGVPLLETRIYSYKISPVFNKYPESELITWCNQPFKVNTSLASIPKHPIIYRKAPKDTTEAAEQQKNHVMNDPQEDTWFRLQTDRNLLILVEQVEKPSRYGHRKRNKYIRTTKKKELNEILHSLTNFEIPEYKPSLKISLSRSDARAIYRALPENALVVLKF